MRELILASGSSRRHSLINKLNLEYRVSAPNIDEGVMNGETPTKYVCRMARNKALAVFEMCATNQVVLAADTIISLHEEIIGKPENIQHAKNILQKLYWTNGEKKIKRTKNPFARILRYFKPQTYKNKKRYTRKGRNAAREIKLSRRGDW